MEKKSSVSRKKTVPTLRLTNTVKPGGMSLQEWQIALRRQAAQKENFGILEVDVQHSPGEYLVMSPATHGRYKVLYYGNNHLLNCCSCMDFRTSQLGTCKHMEAVLAWVSDNKGRHIHKPDVTLTTLYMDYTGEPCVKVHYGNEDTGKLKKIFDPLTNKGAFNFLTELRLSGAIREAFGTSSFFRCRQDVLEYADRRMDDQARCERLDEVFKRHLWWNDVFVKGVRPYVYQREGMEFAARRGRAILADEMGLGKTLQAIGTAELLYREGFISSVLIVCPTSLKYQWKREIKAFVGAEALIVEGSQPIRQKLYSQQERYKIVSYNSLSHDIKAKGSMAVDMVIMDEVQRLKNWDTQIARAARRVRSDYSLILSGTPLENKLEELYSIVQLVDQYLLGPYYAFRQEHIQTTDSGKVTGYKGLNKVGERVKSVLLRRRKADVSIQLPERTDQNLFVPMTKEQSEIHDEYKEMVARIVIKWQKTRFLSETDRRRLLTGLSMMRMVCDSTYILDQKTRCDTKVDETMNIIDSIVSSSEGKVVIFSGWERMTRLIASELDARGILYSNLNGSVPSEKRKDLIDRFTDDSQVRVFLSTDAGATGLNLQAASFVINLDLPWNPAVLEQRIGRIYRMGQKRNIHVINLVAIGTIEEQMLSRLKFKTNLFDGVLNGGEDEVFLDTSKLETMVKDLGFGSDEVTSSDSISDVGESVSAVVDETEPVKSDDVKSDAGNDVDGNDSEIYNTEVPADAGDDPESGDLLAQGVSFIGNLVRTLQNPESSRKFVDSLVREDSATGETSINIPVSNKDSVLQFITMLGKLLK